MLDSGTDEFSHQAAAGYPAGDSPFPFIEREWRRPKISITYRLGLLAVSLAMVLLPLIYFAIVGLCCYGLYRYTADYLSDIFDTPLGYSRGAVLLYFLAVIPFFVGLAFVFFLVKPLFAPRPETRQSFSLNHADAPKLFALIGCICRSLDAPIPSRVDINLGINAGVNFRGGMRSLFGNDLVQAIGLPLVAGLDLGQFAGVLTHEYGHFSQGAAMRAGYLIRQINAWFFRAVYERDKWDRVLVAASEREDQGLLTLFAVWLARFGVWVGRRVLWVLMWTGHALSSFLSRQMEIDADLCEIRMCGSESFVAIQRRLHQLGLGAALAQKQMIEQWKKEKKLFDQIPSLIVRLASEIPAEVQSRHHSVHDRQRTRLFDSHPCDAERNRRATAAREPGIFHSHEPAVNLFTNFSGLARRVTAEYYRELAGPLFREDMFVSTEQAARQAEHDFAADEAINQRYFLGVATALRPMFIVENKTMVVRQPEPLITAIHTNRFAMERLLPEAQAAYPQLHEADARVLHAWQAAHLLRAGFQFDPADFKLLATDLEHAQAEAERGLRSASSLLFPFEEAARNRLADTVQLLRLCQSITIIPDGRRLEEESRQQVWVLSRLGPAFEPLLELRMDCAALDILLKYRRLQPAADNLTPTLEDLCAGIQERINSIQELTQQIRYPFEHPSGQIFVSQYLRNTEYHADPFELALREGNCHVEKSVLLHQRLLANLVQICEEVERHVLS
jgi:hypothetical protein